MCIGCQCPEPLPPPTQTIKKCRLMLQILAVGLIVIGGIGIACSMIFQFFYDLLLIYMLYIGWTTFNWCMTLMFFLFCSMQTVQSLIIFIGMIEYQKLFIKGNVTISMYVLLSLAYYPVAVYFSHFCYKHFKTISPENGQMFPMNRPGGNGGGQAIGGGGNYQRVAEGQQGQQGQPPSFGQRPNQNNNQQSQSNNFFQGQGVRIG